MLLRIWRTRIDQSREGEYTDFELAQSMPMFRSQSGCLGVLFLRGVGECLALTLWEDDAAVVALESSPSYRRTVARLHATGLLREGQSVEVFDVASADVRWSAVEGALSQ